MYLPAYVDFFGECLYQIRSYAKEPFGMLCSAHIHNITPVPRLMTELRLSRAHHGKTALKTVPWHLAVVVSALKRLLTRIRNTFTGTLSKSFSRAL